MHKLCLIALLPLSIAYSGPAWSEAKPAPRQAKVNEPISIKEFSTGRPVDKELQAAAKLASAWTYFGAPRVVTYQALQDGTVTELGFPLANSWEGYKLRDEIEKRFQANSTPNFQFHCTTASDTVRAGGKGFAVSEENCYAHDETQTLLITRRWPKYKDPAIERSPGLKMMVDRSAVTLYNKKLQAAKAAEDRRAVQSAAESDRKKAAADM